MGHPSTPSFRTFQALRIKGFATVDTLAEITAQLPGDVERHLTSMQAEGHAQFREQRSLWQLTADGRAAHTAKLAVDLAGVDQAPLAALYEAFLDINGDFKGLCGDWQLRDGGVNDHADAGYDAAVIDRLGSLDHRAQPVVTAMGEFLDRLAPYAPRLTTTLGRLRAGETKMFTGVMCGSYHDAWMELHEDLIVTQSIDRAAEGSF